MSAEPLLCVCAWCERTRTASGCWEEAASEETLSAEATHGICPRCLAEETRAAASLSVMMDWR